MKRTSATSFTFALAAAVSGCVPPPEYRGGFHLGEVDSYLLKSYHSGKRPDFEKLAGRVKEFGSDLSAARRREDYVDRLRVHFTKIEEARGIVNVHGYYTVEVPMFGHHDIAEDDIPRNAVISLAGSEIGESFPGSKRILLNKEVLEDVGFSRSELTDIYARMKRCTYERQMQGSGAWQLDWYVGPINTLRVDVNTEVVGAEICNWWCRRSIFNFDGEVTLKFRIAQVTIRDQCGDVIKTITIPSRSGRPQPKAAESEVAPQ